MPKAAVARVHMPDARCNADPAIITDHPTPADGFFEVYRPYHPWTNGQTERMNRNVKDTTVKTFHYNRLESLKAHVLAFVTALNFAKHLKSL